VCVFLYITNRRETLSSLERKSPRITTTKKQERKSSLHLKRGSDSLLKLTHTEKGEFCRLWPRASSAPDSAEPTADIYILFLLYIYLYVNCVRFSHDEICFSHQVSTYLQSRFLSRRAAPKTKSTCFFFYECVYSKHFPSNRRKQGVWKEIVIIQ